MSIKLSLNVIFVLTLLALYSCKEKVREDTRSADLKSFIKLVKEVRDSATAVPFTDQNRPVMIDESVKRMKKYMVDTLNSQFSDWDARVLDNTKADPNGTEIRITFGITIDNFNLGETGRYKSIVFKEWLSDAQPPLNEKLKRLNVGDHVKISGSFVIRDKRINVDPYNEKQFMVTKNIFANPEFRVDLTNVNVVEE